MLQYHLLHLYPLFCMAKRNKYLYSCLIKCYVNLSYDGTLLSIGSVQDMRLTIIGLVKVRISLACCIDFLTVTSTFSFSNFVLVKLLHVD